jgi:hypothetical protein
MGLCLRDQIALYNSEISLNSHSSKSLVNKKRLSRKRIHEEDVSAIDEFFSDIEERKSINSSSTHKRQKVNEENVVLMQQKLQ